jgi:hypothetical protein
LDDSETFLLRGVPVQFRAAQSAREKRDRPVVLHKYGANLVVAGVRLDHELRCRLQDAIHQGGFELGKR